MRKNVRHTTWSCHRTSTRYAPLFRPLGGKLNADRIGASWGMVAFLGGTVSNKRFWMSYSFAPMAPFALLSFFCQNVYTATAASFWVKSVTSRGAGAEGSDGSLMAVPP